MRKYSLLAAAIMAALPALTIAQFPTHKVRLASHINLTTFNANSGNSCWGYTSPSGREYALMGLSNKLAAVEITDPDNPVWFDSVAHGSSTWADVKVFGTAAYLVTEREGSGIQVINLANIDNHDISLVQTLMEVGRSHTISVDTTSGFLYTTGSRDSPGTTTCWSLANPLNPVRVGVNSITGGTYVHESMAMTYPPGSPYAGKQVFFASSAFDGLMIWDVTNKNAPVLIKSIQYPQLGYTHQAWISEDLKYVYLDDEFDETTYDIPTRTLVFNVESLENASYLTSYTNGNDAIDHNLYVRDGYIFSSNYTSGLRIWSTHTNPTAPTEVGWIDTYPSDDIPQYEGAWSNYPFFPSGIVIISDINSGLFIVDPTEAMTRNIPPATYQRNRGVQVSGNLASLLADDGNRLTFNPGVTLITSQAPVEFELSARADSTTPRRLDFVSEARASATSIQEKLEFFNYVTNQFELVGTRMLTTTDTVFTYAPTGDLDRFAAANKTIRARLSYRATGPTLVYPWTAAIDRMAWINTP